MLPCPASDPHTHPRGVSFLTETQRSEKYEKVKKMHDALTLTVKTGWKGTRLPWV